jgi:pre-rRNA-processing protein TSR2
MGEAVLPEKIQAQFELGVAVTLFNWPALSLAVANKWGGPDSADKREWFAGAVCDLFAPATAAAAAASRAGAGASNVSGSGSGSGAASTEQPPDVEDVETMLLQVMLDEFEVNVDDDSAFEVAQQIMRLQETTAQGDFALVDELYAAWKRKGGGDAAATAQTVKFRKVEEEEEEDDDDDEDNYDGEDSDDDEDDGTDDGDAASGSVSGGSRRNYGDEDVEMMDADADSSKRPNRRPAAPEVDEEGFTKVVGKKRR